MKVNRNNYIYFYKNQMKVVLRPVDLDKDFNLLFQWVHLPHVIAHWKLNQSKPWVYQYFRKALENKHQSIFIVLINDVEIAYAETYEAKQDRLANFHAVNMHDYGLHLFIGPTEALGRGFSEPILCGIADYLFTKKRANRILVEPHHKVFQFKVLESKLGFLNVGNFKMPEKIANLYIGLPEAFYARFPKQLQPTVIHQTQINCDATDWPILRIHFPNHPSDAMVHDWLTHMDNFLKLKQICIVIATFDSHYQYSSTARRYQALWFKRNTALLKNYCLAMIRVTQDRTMIQKITSNAMRQGMPFQCIPADSIESAEIIALRILKKMQRVNYEKL